MKYVILSCNNNPKYFYYTPLIIWAWKKLGWEVRMMYVRDSNNCATIEDLISNTIGDNWRPHVVTSIDGLSSTTIAQCSRLFASCLLDPLATFSKTEQVYPDDFLLTSDIDMLPLSDIWFKHELPISWGRDLTDYHYPICYIGMSARYWHKVMRLESYSMKEEIKRVLLSRDDAKSSIKSKNWLTDQNLITERLNEFNKTAKSTSSLMKMNGLTRLIDRGTDKRTGYPIGRVDRSNWRLDHDQLIDAHLPHDILTNDESFRKVMQLLHHVWPKEDFKWMLEYHREFKKML